MSLAIVDPASTNLIHLASIDVKFSGAHIGGGIYFSANHNPVPGGSSTAIPQRSLDGAAPQHATTELDYTLPQGSDPWTAYREDTDGNGTPDFVMAGFDMSLQIGARLAGTGAFYDGPAIALLIANDPGDLQGTITITGYPSAANALNGLNGTLHETTGTLSAGSSQFTGQSAYTEQVVTGDSGGYFTIDHASVVGGMSGGGTFLDFDADGNGSPEVYLIGSVARSGVALDETGTAVGSFVQSTAFSPHYAALAAAIENLQGLDARTADDFPRMTLLSAQSAGSALTTVHGQFFHEDIFGGVNDDQLYGEGGNDALRGAAGNDLLSGGVGDDTLTGGSGSDWFDATGFGNGFADVITDFEAGQDVIDLGAWFATLDDVLAATTEGTDGSILIGLPAASGGGTIRVFNTTRTDLTAINMNVACFVAGTLIETRQGPRPIETLRPGDLLLTRDGSFKPLLAIERTPFSLSDLQTRPHLWPVEIAPGALGLNMPDHLLRVSPQHRLLIDSRISARTAHGMALVAAKKFLGAPGISQPKPAADLTYFHLILAGHEVIFANGAWCESFYAGSEAQKCLTPEAQRRYAALCGPRVRPAVPIVEGKPARRLVARHLKNRVEFQAPVA